MKRKRARASRQVSNPKDLDMLSGTLTFSVHQEYAISNATKRSRHATVAVKTGSNAMAMTSRARRPQQTLLADMNTQDTYFNHAVHYTIQDLSDSTTSTSFWVDLLPRSLSQIAATRYALIALAAAHIDFLTQKTANCSAATATKHERSVILHYNMAIRHLQPLLSKATPEDAEAALACCILFICLENIRGRYAESLRHLESGVGLLVSLLVPDAKRRFLTSRKGRLPVALHQAISSTSQNKRNIDHIAVLFSRLSLETHLLTDSEVVPLINISRATPDLGQVELQSLTPIMTLDAARSELHSFEIAHDMFYQQAYSNIKSIPSHGDVRPDQPPEYFLNLFGWGEKVAYQQIYQQFWQWSARFDQYILERASRPRSSKDLSDASKIRLLQKTWTAMLDKEPWTFSGQDFPAIGVLDEFLPEVESIIKLRGPSSRPLITFGADIVPYITIAGYLTDDLGLLQRVISALKLLDTREGFWDSKDIAEIFEASIIAHADLGLDIRHNSKGILHLAKILSEMNIQCISPNNSIALLARNIEP
ncbi:hypothetical protein BGAL_0347g00120 [Botrytis galanthina]|uniref:Transcription factor domain-containing protein n=1 Tax=Botrytis galanthina TaxID=278940 RepID=A0A4S8QQF1_9HELO|nr:hypothetical protein BGAL_0347g00120 [Botrytis galanthina]